MGIIAALRLAGVRALAATGVSPDLVILDGNHDWLTAPEDVGLFAFAADTPITTPPVTTMIKADLKCSSVAAASVIAKVTRDAIMVELGAEHTAYGWIENKGYAAPEHMEALRRHGPSELHRRSWRLPVSMDDDDAVIDLTRVGERRSSEDLEKYESEELALYREYRDVVGLFSHVVETERRFYLCNSVDVKVRSDGGEVFFDVTMHDAWVWDIYRPARFAKTVRVVTFKDVNVEELAKSELELPKGQF